MQGSEQRSSMKGQVKKTKKQNKIKINKKL